MASEHSGAIFVSHNMAFDATITEKINRDPNNLRAYIIFVIWMAKTQYDYRVTNILHYLNQTQRLMKVGSPLGNSEAALIHARTLCNKAYELREEEKEQLGHIWKEKCSEEYRERIKVGVKDGEYQYLGKKEDDDIEMVDKLLEGIEGLKNREMGNREGDVEKGTRKEALSKDH